MIIPSYNHQAYVLGTVASVFAQTFTEYEIIIINDGSPDNTADVLRPLVESGKIRYIEQTNAGQSVARNRGIAEARGEFIALLDDDDLWPPDKLEWQVQVLQENPDVALVYGSISFIDDSGNAIEPFDSQGEKDYRLAGIPQKILQGGATGAVYDKLIEHNYILSPGLCLIRRSALADLGESVFDPQIRGGADDWDLYLRLSEKHPFLFQPKEALYYRVHASNASGDKSKMLQSIVSVRKKLYSKHNGTGMDKSLERRFLDDDCTMLVSSILDGQTSMSIRGRLNILLSMAPYISRALFWRWREHAGKLKSSLLLR